MLILIVDDDPDARALNRRALHQEFPDAAYREAIDLLDLDAALLAGAPDVLVSDFALRWSDGFDVLARVKASAPDCCAVMCTGTGNEELAVRALKTGFDDYVVKSPQQLRRLAAVVRAAFERRTERRRLEDSRDLLLRELYHRLHNNLQIVISLVDRTARTLPSATDREKLHDLAGRIQAISLLQETLYRSNQLEAVPLDSYLQRLVEQHRGLAGGAAIDSRLESLSLGVDRALPLALIANELITNALKHGIDGRPDGRIVVSLERVGPRAVLSVSDNGKAAMPPALETGQLGMGLMAGLARQLEAEITHESASAGWISTVSFTP
jgi:two-component sensor histidine kinase